MTDRELLQKALDALDSWKNIDELDEVQEAIRARLAQPEQEPVAWLQIGLAPFHDGDVIARTTKPEKWNPEWWKFEPLYTTTPQRKPLTDEEIKRIEETTTCVAGESWLRNLCRNIEAAHGIKEKT